MHHSRYNDIYCWRVVGGDILPFAFSTQTRRLQSYVDFYHLCLFCLKCWPKTIQTKIVAVCFCFIKRTFFKYVPPHLSTLKMVLRLTRFSKISLFRTSRKYRKIFKKYFVLPNISESEQARKSANVHRLHKLKRHQPWIHQQTWHSKYILKYLTIFQSCIQVYNFY